AYIHDMDLGDDDTLSLGVLHTGTEFESWGAASQVRYDAIDYGVSFRHDINADGSGRANRFVWGASATRGRDSNRASWPEAQTPSPFLPPPGSPQADLSARRSQIEVFAE